MIGLKSKKGWPSRNDNRKKLLIIKLILFNIIFKKNFIFYCFIYFKIELWKKNSYIKIIIFLIFSENLIFQNLCIQLFNLVYFYV